MPKGATEFSHFVLFHFQITRCILCVNRTDNRNRDSYERTAMRVFLVDDSLIIRQRLTKFLSNFAQVQIIGESREARDAIERILQLKPDVVILDLQLLSGTGFDVLEKIKKAQPAPTVIILTNFPYPEYRKKCLEDGADFFIDKSTAFREIPPVFAKLIYHNGDGAKPNTAPS